MKIINAEFAIERLKAQKGEFTVETIISWLESIAIESEVISWHKISNNDLPEKGGVYLVTLNNTDTDFVEYYPKKKEFGWKGIRCEEVTAWAYLPKPCIE